MFIHQTNGLTDSACFLPPQPNDGKWIEIPDNDPRCVVVEIIPLPRQAQMALDKVTGSSGTIIRCVAAGIVVPIEWTNYVKNLRAIANGSDTISTVLPTQPAYPVGT